MNKKLSLLVAFALSLQIINAQIEYQFNQEELIGKGKIEFYSKTILLKVEAGKAFKKMQIAARKEGFEIEIVSAYRSYERQKEIWNRKYKVNAKDQLTPDENIRKIIEYSTLPGSSRHHWGTDIDIIDGSKKNEGDVLLSHKFHGNGPYAPLRRWLDLNSEKFGFIRPYTNDITRKGFNYEPWHYSYAPIAVPMLKAYLKLDLLKILTPNSLEGSNYITSKFLSSYINENVLGIVHTLK